MAKVDLDRVKGEFKNFALFTNASGLSSDFRRSVELINPSFVIAGEHGLYLDVERGMNFPQIIDDYSQKIIYPIYPEINEDLFETVEGIVVDIQDVGVRCFTFIYELKKIVEIASKKSLKIVVLDRFNPLGKSFGSLCYEEDIVCPKGVPFLYPFTIGKLAKIFGKTLGTEVELYETEGEPSYIEFEKFLSNASQNLNSYQSVLLYPALVLLEGFKKISVGRGTSKPFRMILTEENLVFKLINYIKKLDIKGLLFAETRAKPFYDVLANKMLYGVEFFVEDKTLFNEMYFGFHLFKFFYDNGFEILYDEKGRPFIEKIYPNLLKAVVSDSLEKFYEEELIAGKNFLNSVIV